MQVTLSYHLHDQDREAIDDDPAEQIEERRGHLINNQPRRSAAVFYQVGEETHNLGEVEQGNGTEQDKVVEQELIPVSLVQQSDNGER